MRKEFIECETLEQAVQEALWAEEFVEVEGGFMAFESAHDADIWASQE